MVFSLPYGTTDGGFEMACMLYSGRDLGLIASIPRLHCAAEAEVVCHAVKISLVQSNYIPSVVLDGKLDRAGIV